MRRLVVGLLFGLSVGCTKPNPRACQNGMCSDPAYPFCDTQGTLGGEINECIAVSCTPSEFAECRDNVAVTCNETGDDYLLDECVRGCSIDYAGCLVEPSNGLGAYLDMVDDPPDLTLISGEIDTYTGVITGADPVPNFLLPAPEGGVAVRVFVAANVRIVDAKVVASSFEVRPALAIVATDELRIEGRLTLAPDPAHFRRGAPGGINTGSCVGGVIAYGMTSGGSSADLYTGAGGGGHATPGANGGGILPDAAGGLGGASSGTEQLIPLRGGCDAGSSLRQGHGGGAVQLTSLRAITVSGVIDARGEPGIASSSTAGGNGGANGGGAGGGILLEAPTVVLGATSKLLAHGGGGASHESEGGTSDGASFGGPCTLPKCGAGGNGATSTAPATAGEDVAFDASGPTLYIGGGGGGGLGRVRINTSDGTYTMGSTTLANAAVTAGTTKR